LNLNSRKVRSPTTYIHSVCWQSAFYSIHYNIVIQPFAKMGFGILEDPHMVAPPGTVTISDSNKPGKFQGFGLVAAKMMNYD